MTGFSPVKPFYRRKRAWVLPLLVAATWFAAWEAQSGFGRNPGATLGEAVRADLLQRVTVAGTVTPLKKTVITAPYNGYVRKLFVKVGQHVRAGDPVVTMVQSLLTREEEVFPLRAPIDGTVVQILKQEGEYVEQTAAAPANSIVRIDDLGHLLVEADAPEMEIDKLKIGQDVELKASALLGHTYHGRIRTISLAAKEQSQWEKSRVEFPLLIEITDADEALKPGMSVIVDIVAHKFEKVLTLRHEFIQQDGDKYFVTLKDGTRRPIQVGAQNEEVFEIKGGLEAGTPVRQVDFLESLRAGASGARF